MDKQNDFKHTKPDHVIKAKGKTRITIYLDDEIIESFRVLADESGSGYQTMINEALREYVGKTSCPLDEETLRRVIREELRSS